MNRRFFLIIMILALSFFLQTTNTHGLTAVEYIQNIATNAGGNVNSTEVIGNTGLAYDGTEDNNLRYVGYNPNN